MSRPPKLTATLADELPQAIREGATRREACALVGISYDSLKAWMREGRKATRGLKADLVEAVEDADLIYLANLKGKIYHIGMGQALGDWRPLAWLHGHRQAHTTERLQRRKLKAEIVAIKAKVWEKPEIGIEADLRAIQAIQLTDEERAVLLDSHPIPTAAEDELAEAAELEGIPTKENFERSDMIEENNPLTRA